MKKFKLLQLLLIATILYSCSKSDANVPVPIVNDTTPTSLNPSDYSVKYANGITQYYIYFGENISFSQTNSVSSLLVQGDYKNKINYTYNKPNGTILVGPATPDRPFTIPSTLPFQENSSYSFTITGQNLKFTGNGQNIVLTKLP